MNLSFLHEAIGLSIEKMEANEGGPFGAVSVRDGRVVGRGWNGVRATTHPTACAETVEMRNACNPLDSLLLDGCEIYPGCEPCPMCLAAIYWARLSRIIYAATIEDAAAAGFDDHSFYREF